MYLKKIIRFLVVLLLVLLNGKNTIAQLPVDTLAFPSTYSLSQVNSIKDLEADTAGNIWASFQSIGVLHFDGTNWQVYNRANTGNLLPSDSVYAMYLGKNGALWMITHLGVTRKDSTGFIFYPESPTLPISDPSFSDLTVARDQIFISSKKGVLVYDINSGIWQEFNKTNSLLPSDTVNALFTDQSDNVWVATNNGYVNWTAAGMIPLTSANSSFPEKIVNSIAVTPFDTLIATYNSLYSKNGNTYTNVDSLYSRYLVPDSWCDSLAFGYLTGVPNSYFFSSKLVVAPNNDVYVVRYELPYFIMVINSGGIVRAANLPLYDYLFNRFTTFKQDSLVYYSLQKKCLLKIPSNEVFAYNEPSPELAMEFPATYSFSIPESHKSYGYQADLAPNMISTRILNRGDLGWDPAAQNTYYRVPRYSELNTIYCSAIWFGGYDQQGNLYAAAQTYRQNAGNDFIPGPLDTVGQADSAARVFFNNIWVTRRTDVDEFRYQYAMGSVQNGTFLISPYILNWPAFYNNSAFPQRLAPFVDFNGDGSYNPYDGDYPDIKGEQMSWCVYNDDLVKTETNSPSMFAEIHASAYGYYCPSSQDALSRLIAYTTFYHYDLYNRSDRTYDSCYFGIWSDIELGNGVDDYIGCNITNNTYYAYNGDSIDDGDGGFGLCTPVQNITFLKGPPAPLGDNKDNNHNRIVDEVDEDLGLSGFLIFYSGNNTISSNPHTADDYYGYLVPRWMDDSPVTFGGDGVGSYLGATNIPTKFMFPDTTDSNFSIPWTMPGAGIQPTDVNGNGSVGPFTWLPDSMISFDVAYITGPNDLVQNHDLVRQLRELFRSGGMESYRKFSSPIIGPDSVANAGTIVTYVMPTEAENYIWTVTNGLIISGQGTNTVEVTWGAAGQGTITAEAFDTGAPCERMQTMEVLVGPPLAGDCDSELTVRIYPNPVKSVLQVETEGSCVAFLRILTASGSLVESRAFNGQYDASNLSKGVYILEMSNEEGTPLVRKLFVKN